MIDNPRQVERLIVRFDAFLPLDAAPTSRLAGYISEHHLGFEQPRRCRVVAVHYAGNEGGIMCRLDVDVGENAFVVSITHLAFDPRHPLAREIAAYQKHRIKRIRVMDADQPSRGPPKVAAYTFS